ncbi:hypothetical protein CRE_24212 [Caenorhabditis remanei]|uniref:Uncharacterized protein n=1 Tax=Caenorhabditis remanei TaxID=31234 RepID=E3NCY3_CAERE|nr:hypothetical protein CRE_24212 [Caenorhabditis remanei]
MIVTVASPFAHGVPMQIDLDDFPQHLAFFQLMSVEGILDFCNQFDIVKPLTSAPDEEIKQFCDEFNQCVAKFRRKSFWISKPFDLLSRMSPSKMMKLTFGFADAMDSEEEEVVPGQWSSTEIIKYLEGVGNDGWQVIIVGGGKGLMASALACLKSHMKVYCLPTPSESKETCLSFTAAHKKYYDYFGKKTGKIVYLDGKKVDFDIIRYTDIIICNVPPVDREEMAETVKDLRRFCYQKFLVNKEIEDTTSKNINDDSAEDEKTSENIIADPSKKAD